MNMRILPIILLLTLTGCNRSGQDVALSQTAAEVHQWVPMGSSLAAARQAMEQHQFNCSVTSYDSVEQMKLVKPMEIAIWKESLISNHGTQAVTNVTDLECKQGQSVVLLRLVNGQTMGIYAVQ